jgi:peptide/nickel transport system substrate-binding protein
MQLRFRPAVRPAVLATALLAVALVATACAPSREEAQSGTAAATGTVTVATTTDVVNFNPLLGSSRTDSWITNLMYPRLLNIGQDGKKSAGLATEWGYSDPSTGFWELRNDMKWSDGKPVTAEDVAFTINSILRDKPAGVVTGTMLNVKEAKAASPTRVEVSLIRPDATVVPEVGFWMPIIPQQSFGGQNVGKYPNNSNWVSAGPYRLTSVAKGQSYTFERVAPYPFAPSGTPTAEKIVFRVYPDINTEILALKNGDVDIIANALPPAQVENLRNTSGITVAEVPGLGYAHLCYNLERKPLDKLEVRQALAQSVDYESIRKVVLRDQGVSTNSTPIPPVLTDYFDSTSKEYPFDPDGARRLLEGAGYAADGGGKFPLEFTMIYSLQDAVTAQFATIVRDNAAKAGITIKLKGMDRNAYIAAADAGDYDIYAGNFAIMDDPATNMTLTYLPKGAINYSRVDDPELTELVTKAQATTDPAEQKQLVTQASNLVRDKVYDNVMYSQNLYFAHRNSLSGLVVQPSELLSIVNPQSLANVKAAG